MNKLPVIGIILLCTFSCIEPFHPEIRERQDLLVINGSISDRPGSHFVEVSRSSPYNEPGFIPVKGCVVRVEDINGRGVTYSEEQPGIYRAELDESFLSVNNAYRLHVYTQDGEEYQSDYDSLFACPPIDSLYYEIELPVSDDPDITYLGGVQFYVNVRGDRDDSRNLLWKLEETYVYHSYYLIQYLWENDSAYEFDPPTDSLNRCYTTGSIPEIYTASTRHLVANELNKYPLNFVSAKLPNLRFEYGLLVTQFSLSNEAFLYWEKIRDLLGEKGGLYEKQPVGPDGNIYNVNDPEEQILGYFYASQEQERWIQLKRPFLMYILDAPCMLQVVNLIGLESGSYMVSADFDGWGPPYASGDQACFDCRLLGGTIVPPPNWQLDE